MKKTLRLSLFQQQNPTLEVKFICCDGVRYCSLMVLNLISDFYAKQLAARQRFKNKLEFTYDFSVDTITLFLDALHGVRLVSIRLVDILSLLKER